MSTPHERFLHDPGAFHRPWIESPFFESLLEAQDLTPERAEQARRFRDQGFLVLEDFFDEEQVERVVGRYEWMFDPATRFDLPARRVEVLTRDPARRQDAWRVCPPVRELAADERVLELLRFLYAREPIPFQTLNFVQGTEQSLHADSYHFSALPSGYMCGVWVALEDITPRNGPLRYVPGSHRLPEVHPADLGLWAARDSSTLGRAYELYEQYLQALVEGGGLEVSELVCPKGSALIWAANLLHGGAPVLEAGSTRLSQVTHYYFEDCAYYTPVHSDAALGQYYLREVEDLRTGRVVDHRLNGTALYPCWIRDALHRLSRGGEPSHVYRAFRKLKRMARRAFREQT